MSGRAFLAVLMAGWLASGCATTLWMGNRSTTISVGMTQEQVRTQLGAPQDIVRQELNGMMIETWKYLDRTVTFQNGVLQSWGTQQQP